MANLENLKKGKATQFKKGQSGNPAGKPKGIEHSRTRLKRLLELTQNMTNPITGEVEGFTVLEQMDLKIILQAKEEGNLQAYKEIIDRLEGKAAQSMDVTSGQEKIEGLVIIKNNDDTAIRLANKGN